MYKSAEEAYFSIDGFNVTLLGIAIELCLDQSQTKKLIWS
jgi:hypothetical protein